MNNITVNLLFEFIVGICVNIFTAMLIYFLFERYQKKREKREQINADMINKKYIIRNNQNIINSMLLSQYPPLIERIHTIQIDSFATSVMYLKSDMTVSLVDISTKLRSYSNIALDVKNSLEAMDVDISDIENHSKLINALAVIASDITNHIKCDEFILLSAKRFYSSIINNFDYTLLSVTHVKKLKEYLDDLREKCLDINSITEKEKIVYLSNFAASIGHLSCLFADSILEDFKKHVSRIKQESDILIAELKTDTI